MGSHDARRRFFRLDVGRRRLERAVEDELAFHLEMRTERLVARGLAPAAARAEALRQFGDLPAVRDECLTIDNHRERSMKRVHYLRDLRQDASNAIRSLRHRKAFVAVLLLVLALGIGANTAMFTLVDALLLRPLRVAHPEQLVAIGNPARTGSFAEGSARTDIVSYPVYADVRDQNRVTTGLYASGRAPRLDVVVSGDEGASSAGQRESEHPIGRFVSENFFTVLGVHPVAGRAFTESSVPGANPEVVISHDYWQRRFAGDHSVLGRTLVVNGAPLTVVGVGPAGFPGDVVGQHADLWLPLHMQPTIMPHSPWLTDRSVSWLLLMGRLRPGVTLEQARGDIATLERRSIVEHATAPDAASFEHDLSEHPVLVAPGAQGFSYYRKAYSRSLVTLLAAVGLVLLVVCANVANLMLSRAAARGREIGVRLALGAGRLRLVQQLLTESVLIAAAGGALGLVVAAWGSAALLRLAGGARTPIALDTSVDGRVLAFTALLSLVTAVLFGLAPALRATRVELATALRGQGRGGVGSHDGARRMPMGKLLVVAQVALSLLLLVGTGMLVRSTRRLQQAELGLARDELLLATVDARRSGYDGERLIALLRDLVARASRVPGVVGVTFSENGIFSGTESATTLQVESFTARADSDTTIAYDDVGPGYFAVVGARMLQGRDIEASDDEHAPRVAVLNESAARFYYPQGGALGHHVSVDSMSFEIVGVVADIEEHELRSPPGRRIYFPTVQMAELPGEIKFELRAAGDPSRLTAPVRQALLDADASLSVSGVSTLTDLVGDSIRQDQLVARVVTAFGLLALVLSALGLYGVMAYAAVRRTSEFGLRMALGAQPRQVTTLMLREAMTLTVAGALIGLPVALVAAPLLRGQLFGVSVVDPPSLVVAVAVLVASAALAGYLPARRAAHVAPIEALRAE